jgi:hypothetical protein
MKSFLFLAVAEEARDAGCDFRADISSIAKVEDEAGIPGRLASEARRAEAGAPQVTLDAGQ